MKASSIKIYKDMPEGFHLSLAGLTHADTDRLLHSSDEWEVLGGILLSCQSGDFAPLTRISGLLRHNDGFRFWKAGTELLGYAGSWGAIQEFFGHFSGQLDDRGVQYFLAIPLGNSCGLWAVEPLLTVYARTVEEDPRYQVQRHTSYLLEEENGPLWIGPEEKNIVLDSEDFEVRTVVDVEGYAENVRAARDEIVARVGSTDTPIYEGKMLDVVGTARTLYGRLTTHDNDEGRIYREKMLFEASTGIDCRDFFDKDGQLQYLPAAAIMENFLESELVSRFEPGQRYFFGHRVPR